MSMPSRRVEPVEERDKEYTKKGRGREEEGE